MRWREGGREVGRGGGMVGKEGSGGNKSVVGRERGLKVVKSLNRIVSRSLNLYARSHHQMSLSYNLK